MGEKQEDWDEHLPYVMMAYRSAQHESTKLILQTCSCWEGRSAGLPLDLVVGCPGDERDSTADLHEYTQGLREKIENAHEFARCHLGKSQLHKNRRYDRQARGAGYEPGQPVWLYTPSKKVSRTPKLQL